MRFGSDRLYCGRRLASRSSLALTAPISSRHLLRALPVLLALLAVPDAGAASVRPVAPKAKLRLPSTLDQLANGWRPKDRSLIPFTSDGRLVVFIYPRSGASLALRSIIAKEGGSIQADRPELGVIQAAVPVEAVKILKRDPNVLSVELPPQSLQKCLGSVCTEGDSVLRSDQVRTAGWTGRGVRVGVFSDGIGDIGTSCVAGELPASTCSSIGAHSFSARFDGDLYAGSEGTAMMEIVADVAPNAELFFSNASTALEYLDAIDWFENVAQVDVIADDVAWLIGLYDGRGWVAQRAAGATASGIAYVAAVGNSAVGNSAEQHYEGTYQPEDPSADYTFHLFQAPFNVVRLSAPVGSDVVAYLSWDDPYGGSKNDYDLVLFDEAGNPVASAEDTQDGEPGDLPVERLTFTNTTASDILLLAIAGYLRPQPRSLEIFLTDPTDLLDNVTPSGSVLTPEDGPGVISVGAVAAATPDTLETFSSWGPTNDGRLKPEVVAPDRVLTSVSGFRTFTGTSAAAPHVAGVAALLREQDPSLSVGELTAILMESADDLGPPGLDFAHGAGRVDAFQASAMLSVPRPPEVSGPGRPPFLLRKDAPGIIVAWEDLGPLASEYNIYEGTLEHFMTDAVAPERVNPRYDHGGAALCGLVGTQDPPFRIDGFLPNSGNHNYLVTATRGGREGSAGEGSAGYERDAAQLTCH